MKQLGATDTMFLYNETPRTPLHISSVMVYKPPQGDEEPVRFKDILRRVEERLPKAPVFRRKLSRVAFDIDHPYWVEDENFDLEFHVRHMALPKPGDWRQLCILIARLHSRPLDMDRPPWEFNVIEGLDNINGLPEGSFAIFSKCHHSAIDGTSGSQMIEAIHDLVPHPEPMQEEDTWRPEAEPGQVHKLSKAFTKLFKTPKQIRAVVEHAVKSRSEAVQELLGRAEVEEHPIKEITRFNKTMSPHRIFGGLRLELDEVKSLKQLVDGNCTLNDVVLSVIGGTMRHYLSEKGELPENTLVAGVPINTRTERDVKGEGGNEIAGMRLNLRTDIADPVERLKAIHKDAVSSKAYANAIGAERMVTVLNSIPSGLASLGMRAVTAGGLAARSPIANTIVTNVPGPQFPLYFCGAELSLWMGLGCLSDGVGLFHTVTSYQGYISITFVACREALPDPDLYHQCLNRSFKEHLEAVKKPAKKKQ